MSSRRIGVLKSTETARYRALTETVRIERSRHRIDIPKRLFLPDVWWADSGKETSNDGPSPQASTNSIRCYAKPFYSIPRVQLYPATVDGRHPWEEDTTPFKEVCAQPDEAGCGYMQILRTESVFWEVVLESHGDCCRTTLPEEARNWNLLPRGEGEITVWAFGGVIELWEKGNWLSNGLECNIASHEQKLRWRDELQSRYRTLD